MSNSQLPMFKTWAPEWLIRSTIFLVLLPALAVFALYFSNTAETAGYYGMEPADVQYSSVMMYATLVTILPVDDRFVKYFTPRKYFILGITLNTITYLICALTKNIAVFMVCRFIQGAVCASFCSICMNLIFPRLHSARAKTIGYSIFYGALQVSIPGCALLCSWLLYYFNFNMLFYTLIVLEVPGVVLLLLITNNVRFRKKFPLYQLDWVSYIFYTIIFCAAGYVFVYGQQLNWLDSPQIVNLCLVILAAAALFIVRQFHLKRPFVNLRLFSFVNFRNGLLLLVAYYFFKGTTGFAYAYLQGILGIDPVHLTPIWIINIIGIVLGMFISSRFVLYGTSVKEILIAGFSCLLWYHVQMYFLFSSVSSTSDFFVPFFLQGLGSGALFVPIVLFTVSSVPAPMAGSVSFLGIGFRFIGFCTSISVANYFQLYNRSTHYNRFRANITELNPAMGETMSRIQRSIAMGGQDAKTVKDLSSGVLSKVVAGQVSLRASMDYYAAVIWAMVILILAILFVPQAKKVVISFRKRFIPY
ncbi:MFS transporter [Pedobacter nutrimenti]|uniref:MFS transporter n=1 Tax=Pedobacter nutrimenti TaxID=1241337 RepID=A0A318UG51_9SPHI|nr:MFS transporter [Pedobacter nutrimenti]PYF75113.1 MFS transporter [Pedobacter nutrimenti]